MAYHLAMATSAYPPPGAGGEFCAGGDVTGMIEAHRTGTQRTGREGGIEEQVACLPVIRWMSTADHREAAAAFVDKRSPVFTGEQR